MATFREISRREETTSQSFEDGTSVENKTVWTEVQFDFMDEGDTVEKGDLVIVLEAMKMEQPLTAHKSGKVAKIVAEIGETVASGTALCEIID